MKCINKRHKSGILSGRCRCAAWLMACVTACCGVLFAGCGMDDYADTYQTYETTSAYNLVTDTFLDGTDGFFAEDLCVGGTSNTQTESLTWQDQAEAAAVFNLHTLEITYAKNIYEQVYPASTTKILTAYLAIKYGNLDDEVTVSSNAAAVPEGSSTAGLNTGDVLTVRELLYALLLMSGNEAANAIAEYISGSASDFAALMNEEAKLLGATGSHFVNAHGYPDEDHYTTVYDLYLIFQAALQSDVLLEIIQTTSYEASYENAAGETVTADWTNSNLYLTGEVSLPDAGTVIGGKTGSSDSSGYCLALYSMNDDNEPVISIVMKAASKEYLYAFMSELLEQFG